MCELCIYRAPVLQTHASADGIYFSVYSEVGSPHGKISGKPICRWQSALTDLLVGSADFHYYGCISTYAPYDGVVEHDGTAKVRRNI